MFVLRADFSVDGIVYCNFTKEIPDDIGTESFHAVTKSRLFLIDMLTYPNYLVDFLV
jgi:hypothetical protein